MLDQRLLERALTHHPEDHVVYQQLSHADQRRVKDYQWDMCMAKLSPRGHPFPMRYLWLVAFEMVKKSYILRTDPGDTAHITRHVKSK